LVLPSYEEALREGLGTSRLVIHKIVEVLNSQLISCLDSSLVKASDTVVVGTGSIPAEDSLFVLAALYQRMEMTLVKSLHKFIITNLKYTIDKTETLERGFL
jgi:hypothetical protein